MFFCACRYIEHYNLCTIISLDQLFATRKSCLPGGCMIGFFVLSRLSALSLSRYLFFLWLECCGPFLYANERKGKFGPAHTREKIHLAGLLISPFLTSLGPPSPSILYPSNPLSLSNRLLMSPLPTDPPPATGSQGSLRPSRALLGRRFLPRPGGNKAYSVSASAGERKTYCY